MEKIASTVTHALGGGPLSPLKTRSQQEEAQEESEKGITALIPIAEGIEDYETLLLVDVLTRGGVKVTLASVAEKKDNIVRAAQGLRMKAQRAIENCENVAYDLIVLPGGTGASKVMSGSTALINMLQEQKKSGRWYGGVGCSPAMVLQAHGLLEAPATAHPDHERKLGGKFVHEAVVHNGNCVTSQGAGTSMAYGLKLVELLVGDEKAKSVGNALLFPQAP